MLKKVSLKVLNGALHPDFQHRVDELDEAKVNEYAACFADLPPPVVFHDGKNYYYADGHYRMAAAWSLELSEMTCDVREGGWKDAFEFSLGTNVHGLPRTNADKRKAVRDALRVAKERGWDYSNRRVADLCRLTHTFVNNIVQEEIRLETLSAQQEAEEEEDATPNRRKTKDELHKLAFRKLGELEVILSQLGVYDFCVRGITVIKKALTPKPG